VDIAGAGKTFARWGILAATLGDWVGGMVEVSEGRYARSSDGSQIAYQVIGEGSVDVLVVSPYFIPID
jgi:hypothetical protein